MVIGIDLGTTYSAAAYLDQNGQPHIIPNREGEDTTPSAVLFEDGQVIVGSQAKDSCILDPYNVITFVKRHMGDSTYTFEDVDENMFKPEDISAMILKRIAADCKEYLGEDVDDVVITVPAYFGDAERKATIDAGKIAGLNVLGLVNEPTAAAMAFGMTRSREDSTIMVYDLGGGTFDVTLIKIQDGTFHVLATHGDKNLGGFNFDNELMLYANQIIHEQTGTNPTDNDELQQELRGKCEKAKKELTFKTSTSFVVSIKGHKIKISLSRDQFEQMIEKLIHSTQTSVDIVMEDAHLTCRDINKVLLVGGSTRIPAVRAFIQEKMNIVPSSEVHPDQAVAIGAAFYARELLSKRTEENISDSAPIISETILHDVNSHGLGVIANNDDNELENYVMIPRNSKIPATYKTRFLTHHDAQRAISINVTEGDDSDLRYITVIGNVNMEIAPHPKGSPIEIELSLDVNSIIHVYVYDLVDNIVLCEANIDRKANMTEDDVRTREIRMSQIQPN